MRSAEWGRAVEAGRSEASLRRRKAWTSTSQKPARAAGVTDLPSRGRARGPPAQQSPLNRPGFPGGSLRQTPGWLSQGPSALLARDALALVVLGPATHADAHFVPAAFYTLRRAVGSGRHEPPFGVRADIAPVIDARDAPEQR